MSTMYEEIPTSMEEFSKSIKAKAAAHGISCDISMDREAIARGLALEESDRKQKVAEILRFKTGRRWFLMGNMPWRRR